MATQLEEIVRVGKLKRFLAPQLAEVIVAQGDDSILRNHRRDIAARLCGEAADGEILISSRVADAVGDIAELQATDARILKGFTRAVPAWNVIGMRQVTSPPRW